MKRKVLFAGALFLALGVIGLLSQQNRSDIQDREGAELSGVWYWQNTMPPALFGPDAVLPSVVIFHNDGTAMVSDGIAFGGLPPAFNPYTCTPFYGVWERTGPHEFTATFLSLLFDRTTGILAGIARAREKFAFTNDRRSHRTEDFDNIAGTLQLDLLLSTAGPLKVPDPLAPDANWQPSAMGELPFKAARISCAPY